MAGKIKMIMGVEKRNGRGNFFCEIEMNAGNGKSKGKKNKCAGKNNDNNGSGRSKYNNGGKKN